ncbi:MAG: hypothetical protein IT158_17770 [Bryobacterales bacterium]|nr:hypothetical protein [Bryobacterales bacterium]
MQNESLAEHLSGCDDCLEAMLEQSLGQPVPVRIPEGFARRVASQCAEPSVLPYAVAAACLLFAVLSAWLLAGGWLAGVRSLLADPTRWSAWLLAAGAVQTLALTAWLWRVART